MSTYAKAWAVNALWTLFALCFLLPYGIKAFGGPEFGSLILIGLFGYLACIPLSFVYPKCRNCSQPVNEALTSEHGSGFNRFHAIRPDRPPKTCGYCGHDLT